MRLLGLGLVPLALAGAAGAAKEGGPMFRASGLNHLVDESGAERRRELVLDHLRVLPQPEPQVPDRLRDSSYRPAELGPGEHLDRAVLANCLGGRFSPGIDLTFIVREPELYIQDWTTSGTGPFRVKAAPLDYDHLPPDGQPLLTQGYVPLDDGGEGVESGDISKFMAIPWHTDYNSCATHLPSPYPPHIDPAANFKLGKYLFWSWPAQRPVAVYEARDVYQNYLKQKSAGGEPNPLVRRIDPDNPQAGLPLQKWSVRGDHTSTNDTPAQHWGRYQKGHVRDFLANWPKIGVVLNARAIDSQEVGAALPPSFDDYYLEAQSLLEEAAAGNRVEPFPNLEGQMPETARLPGDRVAVAVASDAETVKRLRLREPARWSAGLGQTLHLASQLTGCSLAKGGLEVAVAPTFVLDRAAGERWLAVGDAASAFDPISGQGIEKALSGGLEAAAAIIATRAGDSAALAAYGDAVAGRFAAYLELRRFFYALEQRWPESPFWRDRRPDPTAER